MRVDVAFLPSLLLRPERSICVVIDVLRATSTLVTLVAGGVREVTVVAEQPQALALRDRGAVEIDALPRVVCGEVGGVAPPGFDYGNSAVEFSRLDLRGRAAVLFTSNGTKALVHLAVAPAVLVGALLNRTAVVQVALAAARATGLDLTFVCSGTHFGTAYSLEDAFCAGALMAAAEQMAGEEIDAGDAALAALRLYRSYDGDAAAAFRESEHGRVLSGLGFDGDLEYCARNDVYDTVPWASLQDSLVVVRGDGTVRVSDIVAEGSPIDLSSRLDKDAGR